MCRPFDLCHFDKRRFNNSAEVLISEPGNRFVRGSNILWNNFWSLLIFMRWLSNWISHLLKIKLRIKFPQGGLVSESLLLLFIPQNQLKHIVKMHLRSSWHIVLHNRNNITRSKFEKHVFWKGSKRLFEKHLGQSPL